MNNAVIVNINDFGITNDDKTIICTSALATCIGVLLYDEFDKIAALGHFYSNLSGSIYEEEANNIFSNIVMMLDENNLINKQIKYMIIPGGHAYYYNSEKIYKICDQLDSMFKNYSNFKPFDQKELKENSIRENINTKSLEVAFDASTGNFVTHIVFPNDMDFDHYELYTNYNVKQL
ncbi:MAG: hypothetical protein IJ105_04875 [Bacilli bacterium]|nr:hypothetical protein [Bacilli bacterium]